eukprot:6208993-Pleurochrysis_carterae.AAC.2
MRNGSAHAATSRRTMGIVDNLPSRPQASMQHIFFPSLLKHRYNSGRGGGRPRWNLASNIGEIHAGWLAPFQYLHQAH